MASSKRLAKELGDLVTEPIDGITVETNDENIYKWNVKMQGPASTPYAQGTFDLAVDFPIEYPFKGPKVRFLTPVYHPNIDNDGNICIGVLKSEAWKPSTKAITFLMSIQNLLREPDPDDALIASIAELYKTDHNKFVKLATEHTKKYATT